MSKLIDLKYSSKALPMIPVGHENYVWYGAADTDVQRTWRRFGWTPIHTPTEEVEPVPARRVIRIVRKGKADQHAKAQ